MIRISQVARRYGYVLYTLSKASHSEEKTFKDLRTLSDILKQASDLDMAFKNPLISKYELMSIIESLSERLHFDQTFQNFLNILAINRRLGEFSGILEAFRDAFNHDRFERNVIVKSSYPLSEAHKKRLENILKTKTGHVVVITNIIDKSLIGGIVIRLGSIIIDSSLQRKIVKLKQILERVM